MKFPTAQPTTRTNEPPTNNGKVIADSEAGSLNAGSSAGLTMGRACDISADACKNQVEDECWIGCGEANAITSKVSR